MVQRQAVSHDCDTSRTNTPQEPTIKVMIDHHIKRLGVVEFRDRTVALQNRSPGSMPLIMFEPVFLWQVPSTSCVTTTTPLHRNGVATRAVRAGGGSGADPERVLQEIEEVIGLDCSGAILASAKQRIGVKEILEAVVSRVPPPEDSRTAPLRALIFDSYYDPYRGVIVYFRVIDGTVSKGDKVRVAESRRGRGREEIWKNVGCREHSQTSLPEDWD